MGGNNFQEVFERFGPDRGSSQDFPSLAHNLFDVAPGLDPRVLRTKLDRPHFGRPMAERSLLIKGNTVPRPGLTFFFLPGFCISTDWFFLGLFFLYFFYSRIPQNIRSAVAASDLPFRLRLGSALREILMPGSCAGSCQTGEAQG